MHGLFVTGGELRHSEQLGDVLLARRQAQFGRAEFLATDVKDDGPVHPRAADGEEQFEMAVCQAVGFEFIGQQHVECHARPLALPRLRLLVIQTRQACGDGMRERIVRPLVRVTQDSPVSKEFVND